MTTIQPASAKRMDNYQQGLASIIAALTEDLASETRYLRFIDALRHAFPCDAIALLRINGELLEPVAAIGFADEILGRRFAIGAHPRLARLLASQGIERFTGSDLPDPYDGLIENGPDILPIHDCMGAVLHVDNRTWGVITLDALTPGSFDTFDPGMLNIFLRLAEATIKIGNTIEQLQTRADREHLVNISLQETHGSPELVGASPAIQALRQSITTVASSDLLVLVQGETGVGKELVAWQLHSQSQRAHRPMVYVNCAALPENLVESELFGHRKGSFTGALQDRPGKFELADGSTLLLDEIGELPLSIQAKLLRVLQSGEIQRVGSDRNHRVDVRVIAATNRNLAEEVKAGQFRADLYHRLSVFPIQVPPLRDRGRDILLLANYFLAATQRKLHTSNLRLSKESRQALMHYHWPGNVRELDHLMSRSALLAKADQQSSHRWITIEPRHLGLPASHQGQPSTAEPDTNNDATTHPGNQSLSSALDSFTRTWLINALAGNEDNIARAARQAGMDRSNFFRLLKRHGLR